MASSISLPKSGLKTVLIESLYNEIVSNTNNYYYFIGKPQEWANGETAIETPTLAITSDSDARRDMVFAKKITGADVSFTIPRINWKSGTVYDIYDDRVGDVFELYTNAAAAGTNILTFETALNSSITASNVESIMQRFGEGWAVTGSNSLFVDSINSDTNPNNDLPSNNPIPDGTYVQSASYNTITGTITVVLDNPLLFNIITTEGIGNNKISFRCLAYSGASSLKQSAENRTGPYVYTPDRHVYKCLFNNRGAESTVMPYSTSHELIVTTDGYVWKYMYTIPNALFNKFTTSLDMPVTTAVRAPYYSGGAITNATVQSYGSGYSYTTTPTITVRGDGYLAENPFRIVGFSVYDGGLGYVTAPGIVVDPPFLSVSWIPNTEYATGTKVTARNTDIYEVVAPGVSGLVPPTHTSSEPIPNGTTQLKFVGRQAVVQVGSTNRVAITSITENNTINYTGTALVGGQQVQFTDTYTPIQIVPTTSIASNIGIIASGHPFVANQGVTFDYNCSIVYTILTSNVNTASTDETMTVSVVNHGMETGCIVTYNSNGTSIQNLINGNQYYVIKVTNNTIKLAATLQQALAGNPVDLQSTGNDNQTITYTPIVANTTYYVKTVTIPGVSFTISATPGGTAIPLVPRTYNTNVRAATAIIANTIYWVSSATSSTFKISATSGGPELVIAPNSLNFQPSHINTTNETLTYTPTTVYNIPTINVNTTTDTIFIGNHRLTTGSRVVYRSVGGGATNTAISPLSNNTSYYAIVVSPTTIRLALTSAAAYLGTYINIASTGNNDQCFIYTAAASHGLSTDVPVKYYKNGGTPAAVASSPITDGTTFYVVNDGIKTLSSTSFKLATQQDGTAVNFTSELYTTTQVINPTNVNTTTGIITINNHGWSTGLPVVYTANGTAMVAAGTYYVIVVSANTIKLAANTYDAYHNTAITLTTTGNISQTLKRVTSAGNPSQQFSWYGWNRYGIQILNVNVSGIGGQFICDNATLSVGKQITVTGTLTGTGSITGYITGATYIVTSVTGTTPSVTGFTLQTLSGGLLTTSPGTLTGLTFTSNTNLGDTAAYVQTGLGTVGANSFNTNTAYNVTSVSSGNIINTSSNSLYANQPIWFANDYLTTYTINTNDLLHPVSFTRANNNNIVDNIDTNLGIQRYTTGSPATENGGSGFIYNPNLESYHNSASPAGTLWNIADYSGATQWGDLSNVTTRTYGALQSVLAAYKTWYIANVDPNNPDFGQSGVGGVISYPYLVMKDTINNKYYKFKFSDWTTSNSGGGFAYTRELIYPGIHLPSHGFVTGDKIRYTANGVQAMTPLVSGTDYYAIVSNPDYFDVATSYANANAGTRIVLTNAGNNNQTFSKVNIAANDIYYVSPNNLSPTTLKIRTTTGGSDIILPASTIINPFVTTVNTGAVISNVIYAHNSLRENQAIKFDDSVSSIASNTLYYVSANGLTSTTFKIKETLTGSDKTISGTTKYVTTVRPYDSLTTLSDRQMIGYVSLSNPGRGYSQNIVPNVTISGGPIDSSKRAQATASVTSEGYLNRIVVRDRGSDYTSGVTVTIDPPPQLIAPFNATSSLVVDLTNNTITLPNAANSPGSGFYTGARVKYTSGSASPIGGLVNNGTYYTIATSANTVKLTSSFYDAMKQINHINLTSLGGGSGVYAYHDLSLDVEQAQAYVEPYIGFGYSGPPTVTVADPFTSDEVAHIFAPGVDGYSDQHVTVNEILMSTSVGGVGQNIFYRVLPTTYSVNTTQVSLPANTITIVNHNIPTGTLLSYQNGGGTSMASTLGSLTSSTTTSTTVGVDDVDLEHSFIYIYGHGFTTGDPVQYLQNDVVGISPLEDTEVYFVVVVDADTIMLAETAEDALAASPITITLLTTGNNAQTFSYTTGYYVVSVDASTIKLASSVANALATTPVTLDLTNAGNISQYFRVQYPQLYTKPEFTSGIGMSGTATLEVVGRTASVSPLGARTSARLVPLIDGGGLVGIIAQDPGIGYTSADLTAEGSSTGNPAIIVPNLSIGDVQTRQANTELLAVPGTIDSIVVLHKGSNYSSVSGNIQVKITGDGTGAAATATVVDGQVTKIDVTERGTGYSRAAIEIVGVPASGPTLEKAFARAIISPRRGHGSNAVSELYATDITLTSSFGTEKNQGFYIGYDAQANVLQNDYHQFGIIKNPQLVGSTLRYSKPLASTCYAINITFASGITYDPTQKGEGDIPMDSILLEKDSAKPAYRYMIVDSSEISGGARILVSAIDNAAPYVGQTLKRETGTETINIGTVTAVTPPDIDKYSGEIMFLDNREAFQTSADQTVAVKTTIRL